MINIYDLSFSSSSIDDVFTPHIPKSTHQATGRLRISSNIIPPGFVHVADDNLVRIAEQDFWKIGFDAEGYFIERLVDDNNPVRG